MAVAQASTSSGAAPRSKKWAAFLRNNASLLFIYGLILIVGIICRHESRKLPHHVQYGEYYAADDLAGDDRHRAKCGHPDRRN